MRLVRAQIGRERQGGIRLNLQLLVKMAEITKTAPIQERITPKPHGVVCATLYSTILHLLPPLPGASSRYFRLQIIRRFDLVFLGFVASIRHAFPFYRTHEAVDYWFQVLKIPPIWINAPKLTLKLQYHKMRVG